MTKEIKSALILLRIVKRHSFIFETKLISIIHNLWFIFDQKWNELDDLYNFIIHTFYIIIQIILQFLLKNLAFTQLVIPKKSDSNWAPITSETQWTCAVSASVAVLFPKVCTKRTKHWYFMLYPILFLAYLNPTFAEIFSS